MRLCPSSVNRLIRYRVSGLNLSGYMCRSRLSRTSFVGKEAYLAFKAEISSKSRSICLFFSSLTSSTSLPESSWFGTSVANYGLSESKLCATSFMDLLLRLSGGSSMLPYEASGW